MKNKKPNAELVWKQLEDLLAPRLRLSVIDRTVYSHSAAQPPGRETPPPVFPYVAGTQYPAIHRAGARGCTPARGPKAPSAGPTHQSRARGGGGTARRESRREAG